METFNIIMRTHEGNRPNLNIQFDNDKSSMEFFSRMSRIHFHLKPYSQYVIKKANEEGKSCLIRHMDYQYFFGEDLLIAPVIKSEVNKWKVTIPDGEWIHIWTNQIFESNQYQIDAPLGQPPVFYRSTTQWKLLFQQIKLIN